MDLVTITPLILTYNEEPNIDRTLSKLTWAREIIVIDSFSTDKTLEILKSYPNVKFYQRKFDTHAQQWNYGLEQINSQWVLSMDADYSITEKLLSEIENLKPDSLADVILYPLNTVYLVNR